MEKFRAVLQIDCVASGMVHDYNVIHALKTVLSFTRYTDILFIQESIIDKTTSTGDVVIHGVFDYEIETFTHKDAEYAIEYALSKVIWGEIITLEKTEIFVEKRHES